MAANLYRGSESRESKSLDRPPVDGRSVRYFWPSISKVRRTTSAGSGAALSVDVIVNDSNASLVSSLEEATASSATLGATGSPAPGIIDPTALVTLEANRANNCTGLFGL